MKNLLLAAAFGVALGVGGLTMARHFEAGDPTIKPLSATDVAETLNGKDARVTMVEVNLEPGAAGKAHRHPGPIFGYVLEGTFEMALDDQPVKTLKTGDTFYEPGGALHRVSRNPSATGKTRVLAVILHPREATELATPEASKKD